MPKRSTRKNTRGFASRIFAPVGSVVNTTGTIVKNIFRGAKKVGHHAVQGTNKLVNTIANSISSKRGRRTTRRRKN
jgi:hypothetical protein